MAEIFDILTIDKIEGSATDIGEVYETVLELTTVAREAGSYCVNMKFIPLFPDTVRVVNWRLIGDLVSAEYTHKNSTLADYEPHLDRFHIEHIGGVFTTTLEALKGAGGAQLDFDEVTISFERIG